jgi:hypothetical protein
MSDEAFARDVLKIAVAQACHQMDFTNIESSALEVLIDLVQLCMCLFEDPNSASKLTITQLADPPHFVLQISGK